MPAMHSGTSLQDAIDVDDDSDSDDVFHQARSETNLAAGGSGRKEFVRILDSESPPLLPVASSSMATNGSGPSARRKQTGRRGRPLGAGPSTRERLLSALQPPRADRGSPSPTQSTLPSPSSQSTMPSMTDTNGVTYSHSNLRAPPPSQSPSQSRSSTTRRAEGHSSFSAPRSVTSAVSASPFADRSGSHKTFLIQVVPIAVLESVPPHSLPHGRELTPRPVVSDEAGRTWQIDLINTDGTKVGHWNSQEADELQKMVNTYDFILHFRYLNPMAVLGIAGGGAIQADSRLALLTVSCPRAGGFCMSMLPLVEGRLRSDFVALKAVHRSSAMPSRILAVHSELLRRVLRTVKHYEQQQGQHAARHPAVQQRPGLGQRALNYVSSHMSQLGLPIPGLGGNDAVPSYQEAIARALEVAGLAMPPGASAAATPSLEGLSRGWPPTHPSNGMPGDLPVNPADFVDDPDMLLAALEGEDEDEYAEPIDDDMQEILNNMADGTFHGTDALATLYGDKGVDVARLPLYSDIESLKQRGLKTELHHHQLQGLLWMVRAEHRRVSTTDGKVRGLWQTKADARGRLFYKNIATRKCRRKPPPLPRGGINADSMGLGKTIQIIATCLADRNRVPKGIKPQIVELENSQDDGEGSSETANKALEGGTNEAKKEEDEEGDGNDSEDDYMSETDAKEEEEEDKKPAGGSRSVKRSRTSDEDSETEEDSDVQPVVKRVKEEETRPTDSEGRGMTTTKRESDTEEEDEKPRVRMRAAARPSMKGSGKTDGEEDKDIKGKQKAKDDVEKKDVEEEKKAEEDYNETTLVICPLSVLQNWTGQVDQHCDRRKVTYFVHHADGAKNLRKKANFAKYMGKHTFVFTTYDVVRAEYRVIQKRREEEMEVARKQAAKDAEGSNAESREESLLPTDEDSKASSLTEKGRGSLRGDTTSRELTAESDFKPEGGADTEGEDTSKRLVRKPKAKGKGKSKRKSKGREQWYDSDDSFIASEYEEGDELSPRDPGEIPLFEIKWRRIVLDEAHICRNARTNLYHAICELQAERRWAVTGTPIVNSTKDLGALAAWCGLHPFSYDGKEWSKLIERPLKKSAELREQAAGLLRSVVTNICLRRHKSMKDATGEALVKLPEVRFYKHTIPLTTADRDYYEKCEAACRDHLARWVREGEMSEHRSAVLLFLLRLRQMSCHRRLIGSQLLEEIQNTDWDALDKTRPIPVALTKEAIKKLQEKLKMHVEMNDDCPICLECLLGKEPMITPCGHPFCKSCLSSHVHSASLTEPPKCPMDRQLLPKMELMIEPPKEGDMEEDEDEDDGYEDVATSAKVNEAMKIIRGTLKRDPTEKILIFSNFVKFLNIFGEELTEAKISHARFNGQLNVRRRDAVLKSFCQPITPRQALVVQYRVRKLEEKIERERAAQKAAAEAEAAAKGKDKEATGAPPSSSSSASSSLLADLRGIDRTLMTTKTSAPPKRKINDKAQEYDVIGENPSVLLISMGCGALGLNLTAASTVLLCDPWWQSSAEQQAIDRTHRIGQNREVKVFQIICENTVEARVLEIQAVKEGLTETAFSGMRARGSASDRRQKIESNWKDLGRLFGMDQTQINQLSRVAAATSASRS